MRKKFEFFAQVVHLLLIFIHYNYYYYYFIILFHYVCQMSLYQLSTLMFMSKIHRGQHTLEVHSSWINGTSGVLESHKSFSGDSISPCMWLAEGSSCAMNMLGVSEGQEVIDWIKVLSHFVLSLLLLCFLFFASVCLLEDFVYTNFII